MKKLNNNWKKINEIILNILTVDFVFSNKLNKTLIHCNFENIAKGRCLINIEPKISRKKNEIIIFSDKALINVNVYYNKETIKEILISLSNKTNRKNKAKVFLKEELFVNDNGYLFVKENTKIEIEDIEWLIPFI